MVKLVRINGEAIYLNIFEIEHIEQIPETKICMMNGRYYLVNDTVESIIDQMKDFLSECIAFRDKPR